ncbi:hypothetical protein [Sorangium sp. So ce426]|uniref:hypothetical protein n=1 Tax=Sorangium sp. So ce426 TaxID=3133312 RepID=UPI003F5CB04B
MSREIVDLVLGKLLTQAPQHTKPPFAIGTGSATSLHQPSILFCSDTAKILVWNPSRVVAMYDVEQFLDRMLHGHVTLDPSTLLRRLMPTPSFT